MDIAPQRIQAAAGVWVTWGKIAVRLGNGRKLWREALLLKQNNERMCSRIFRKWRKVAAWRKQDPIVRPAA